MKKKKKQNPFSLFALMKSRDISTIFKNKLPPTVLNQSAQGSFWGSGGAEPNPPLMLKNINLSQLILTVTQSTIGVEKIFTACKDYNFSLDLK